MTDFTAEELVHERAMSDDGAERYWSETFAARARGANALTVPGRAMVRHCLRPVERELEAWLAEAKAGPGPGHGVAPLIRKLPVPTVAFIATVTLIDGLLGPRSAASWGVALGRALEDEVRFLAVKRADPAFWKDATDRTTHLGPVRRRAWLVKRSRQYGVLPAHWRVKDKAQVGAILLGVLERATGLIENRVVRIDPKRTQNTVFPTDEAVEWIARADERAAAATALYRPMLEEPLDWLAPVGGGYRTDLVLRRPIARFRGPGHEDLVERTPPDQFQEALSGVNALQRVRWRVNEPVLEVAEHLLRTGGQPLTDLARLPMPPRPAKDAPKEDWADWRRTARATHRLNDQRDGRRILAARTVETARPLVGTDFWMPHRLCFRGRAYPTPSWLQPQGPDIARGLLRFAESDPMTPEGWSALMAWGRELGCEVEDAEAARAVHRDPLDAAHLWTDLGDPFQGLAWYLEVGAALDAGYPHRPFLTSLPCYVDASNNGLQLYSLLTGDRDLARWTNVLPGEKHDLYTRVAEIAWAKVTAAVNDPEHWAHRWAVDLAGVLGDGIPRSCAKRPVMTRPYNVTPWSAADYVREWYFDSYTTASDPWGPLEHNQKSTRYLAKVLMEGVDEAAPGAAEAMRWLGACADHCTGNGLPMRWVAPSGWPVQQEYWAPKTRRVRALLGGSVRSITINEDSHDLDVERQRRASGPNFIHSVDASVMSLAAAEFEGPLAAIHDAFGSTAPRMPALHAALRGAVVEVCLNRAPFQVTHRFLGEYVGKSAPEPPVRGTIEAEEVLASQHLFG